MSKTVTNVIILVAIVFILGIHGNVMAQLRDGEIAINRIVMRDFLSDKPEGNEVIVRESDNDLILFYRDVNRFRIEVYGHPFVQARANAEKSLLETLNITKNESCFLLVNVVAPASAHPDVIAKPKLSFCEGPARVDFNEDEIVNTLDYAQCIDEASPQGGSAPSENVINQEGLQDLQCDFNLNGKIDASDISIGIQYFGQEVVYDEVTTFSFDGELPE